MSMLSAQVDELRKLAGDGSMEWVAGPIRTSVLREAADTIWELRDDLQRANAENDKLREELVDAPKCETCEAMLDCDECLRADVSHKDLRRLSTENACLREMCRDMLHDAMENVCSKARWCDEKNWQTCNDKECGNRLYVEMARELGIEVDA